MSTLCYESSYNELYHHGIKGMKWGVRRYQNKDGSLTGAGRKRYKDNPEVQASKATMKADRKEKDKAYNAYQLNSTTKNWDTYVDSKKQYNASKFNYKTTKEVARLKENGKTFEKKSKHRLRLEEQYRKSGLSPEQAQAAANNRIRTEKILAASAALTVTACAAYAASKTIRDRTDKIIKSGDLLQRIEMQDTKGKLHDSFYVSSGKHDNKRYAGMLGKTRKQQTGHAYIMKLQAQNDVKVASKDKARKVFEELYRNDNDFRKAIEPHVGQHLTGRNSVNTTKLSKRNINKMYENFNSGLIVIKDSGSGADQKFYNKLKKAGYGAIVDINDQKFSGYNARNPYIVFDNRNNNIMVKSMKEMTGDLNKRGSVELLKAAGEQYSKDFMSKKMPVAAVGLTAAAGVTYGSQARNPNNEVKKKKKSR